MPATHWPLSFVFDLALLAVFTGIGLAIVRPFMPDKSLQILTASGLALPLFSYTIFTLGVFSLLKPPIFIGLLLLLACIAAKPLKDFLTGLSFSDHMPSFDRVEQGLLFLFVTSAIFRLWFGYAPPTADDELVYHISLPTLYVHMGRLVEVRSVFNSYFPQNAEMIYTGLLLLRNVFAVKTMVWLCAGLFTLAFYFAARRYFALDRKHALFAAVVVYTAPVMTSMQGICSVDLMNLFLEVVTVCLYWEWSRAPKLSLALWMGLFAGAALSCRNYAATWIVSVFSMMVLLDRRPKDALCFGLAAACIFSPWPIRAYVLTGNPFYPQALWKSAATDPYLTAMSSYTSPANFLRTLARIPLYLSGGTLTWDFGLIPFSLAPFAWLKKESFQTTLKLSFMTVVILVLTHCLPWTWNGPRYYSASLPWVALLAVQGLLFLEENASGIMKKIIFIWLGTALLIPNWALSAYFGVKRVPYFFGFESEEKYLSRQYPGLEGYDMMQYVLSQVHPENGLLMLGTISCTYYYYYVGHRIFPQTALPVSFYKQDAHGLARDLSDRGIQYVLLCDSHFSRGKEGHLHFVDLPRMDFWLPALESPDFEIVHQTAQSTLYKVGASK